MNRLGTCADHLCSGVVPYHTTATTGAGQGDGPRITRVEAIVCKAVHRPATNTVLCKISTNAGITGWGEGSIELKELTVATCIEELAPHCIGEDARRVEYIYQKLYEGSFWKGGQIVGSALSAIEQALWDIKGKSLGVPSHELLGGRCRDKIRIYGHFGQGARWAAGTGETGSDTAAQLAAAGLEATADGLTCIKMGLTMGLYAQHDTRVSGDMAENMRRIREAVGEQIDICIDMHGRLNPACALQMIEAVAPYRPFWVEEPCPPENINVMQSLIASSPVPIATGTKTGVPSCALILAQTIIAAEMLLYSVQVFALNGAC